MAVQKINYTSKTDLSTTSVPAANKVSASDMNEIKTVTNNNADELTNLSKVKGTILWTNPNPNEPITNQTITLSSSDYDIIEVFYYDWITGKNVLSTRAPKNQIIKLQCSIIYNNQSFIGARIIGNLSSTSYYIDNNKTLVNASAFSIVNAPDWNIPLYIVGYKTGLF